MSNDLDLNTAVSAGVTIEPAASDAGSGRSDCADRVYGFYLVPDFPLLAFATAIEPLRIANRLSGQQLYRWPLFTPHDGAVIASNGMRLVPDGRLADIEQLDALFAASGMHVQRHCDAATLRPLRRAARRGVTVGAISIASVMLAKAGLLDGYRCTLHWENLDSFAEQFPALEVSPELFEIDRNRITCSGGTAALDMMLTLIRRRHGQELAKAVAEQCIHPQIRDRHERQRMDLRTRLDVAHPKLLRAVAAMQANIEEPRDCAALAAEVSLTLRQLERLFQRHFELTPKQYYLRIRLQRAQKLLRQTSLPVVGVAAASGFSSPSYFAACYRRYFGHPPRRERGG